MFKKLRNRKGFSGVEELLVIGGAIVILIGRAWSMGYGFDPVKNCIGTHINDNCANEKLNAIETDTSGVDWSQFAN